MNCTDVLVRCLANTTNYSSPALRAPPELLHNRALASTKTYLQQLPRLSFYGETRTPTTVELQHCCSHRNHAS